MVNEETWEPRLWHRVSGGENTWRQTSEGIEVRGEGEVRRTKGEPITLTKIVDTWGDRIAFCAKELDLDRRLLAGVIGAESLGRPGVSKEEPHIQDASYGLTQVLTASARFLAKSAPESMGVHHIAHMAALPDGGSEEAWEAVLTDPDNSIALGALALRYANDNFDCRMDPIFSYAVYNAGGLRPSNTPWGIHYFRQFLTERSIWADAMDSFSRWYGDACAVYAEC